MRAPRLVHRLGLVAVLAVVYLIAVRPARVAFLEHVATPLFAQGDEVQAGRITLTPDRTVVMARGDDVDGRVGEGEALFKTPLGDRPMLGVLALAFLFPSRRWWLVLAGTALAEGVITTVCFTAGTHGVPGAFVGHRVAQAVLNDTLPLAMPALLYLLGRSGYLEPAVDSEVNQANSQALAETASTAVGSATSGVDSSSRSSR